jgi:Ca2+:H+ antiporter
VIRRPTRGETTTLAAVAVTAVIAGGTSLLGAPNTVVFLASAVALLGLAWAVGATTEQLAGSAGPKLGGVLNATFGNAAELIITLFAIRAGQLGIAHAAVTGSILGNTLLVLGASFVAGGLRHGQQRFDQRVAGMNASMLALAVIGLAIPTVFGLSSHQHVERISDITAAVLLGCYMLSLLYYFRDPGMRDVIAAQHDPSGHWPGLLAGLGLLVATVAVAVLSDVFVGTLEGVTSDLGISAAFLGLVIVPVVGNIPEHLVGVRLALRNQTDFSMLVSLGSAQQVALGVAPVLVLASLLTPHHFELVFPPIQVVALTAAVVITALIAADGESNWLEGVQLLAVYLITATAFWYL